jgi:AcrR family transcriptional regulator
MPKAFSAREREIIRETLVSEGTKLFDRFGLKKTTVDDLAKAANISKGAFYLFYATKEELYFDILERMENDFRAEIFSKVFRDGLPKRESFRNFLELAFDLMEANPAFSRFSEADYAYLVRRLPEETLARHLKRDNDFGTAFYGEWRKSGVFREIAPDAFNGLMRTMFFLIIHRADLGPQFGSTKEAFIDMISGYLVAEKE